MFICDKCGECCRSLHKSDLYSNLHSGDGICKFLKGNVCGIYENRPLLCNVDESYEAIFKNVMTKELYYELNYKTCLELKNKI